MKKSTLLALIAPLFLMSEPLKIINKPIKFTNERVEMTRDYIEQHYGKRVKDITIIPRIVLIHWTAEVDFDRSYARLYPEKLLGDRTDIVKAGAVNVSSHYMVDRDGTIYKLMPDNHMARHAIGLNYSAIGIENVGGKGDKTQDLTDAQLEANIALVRYLKGKYPTINYLIGHHEYLKMEQTPLWLEKDKNYRTRKNDPGEQFMKRVRGAVKELRLLAPPQ
jgi:N-acetyl-anhydromuramyl-L-alanine amidase AmpD